MTRLVLSADVGVNEKEKDKPQTPSVDVKLHVMLELGTHLVQKSTLGCFGGINCDWTGPPCPFYPDIFSLINIKQLFIRHL